MSRASRVRGVARGQVEGWVLAMMMMMMMMQGMPPTGQGGMPPTGQGGMPPTGQGQRGMPPTGQRQGGDRALGWCPMTGLGMTWQRDESS